MAQQLDILAFAAHPDDTELCCGGTLARLVQQQKKVGVVDLTQGEMGTRGTPEQRLREAQNAAEIIGLEVRENLGLPDTQLKNNREHQIQLIRKIRAYRPHIVFVGAPWDRHPDHGYATKLQLDSCFYSGLASLETFDADGKAQEPWRPAHIIHYMQDRPFEPDFIFDISDTMAVKEQALKAFETQFNVPLEDEGPQTYISSPTFFEGVRARARHYGHLGGFTYGEPLKYYNGPIPLSDLELFSATDPQR
ncbi:MAG: bacillithiol biosynthesis deacetylase BshB1 [Bacteroidota bacterium]